MSLIRSRKVTAGLFALIFVSTVASSVAPALALGGCGPNRHRDGYGRCVFGGQNQDFCLRRTGHTATRMPNGTLRCL